MKEKPQPDSEAFLIEASTSNHSDLELLIEILKGSVTTHGVVPNLSL